MIQKWNVVLYSAVYFRIFAASRTAIAQQTGKVIASASLDRKRVELGEQIAALRQGLRELGYEEGKNLVIEYRWAEDDFDRLPKLAAELVSLKVDLIVTHGSQGAGQRSRRQRQFPSSWRQSGTRYEAGSSQASPARAGI